MAHLPDRSLSSHGSGNTRDNRKTPGNGIDPVAIDLGDEDADNSAEGPLTDAPVHPLDGAQVVRLILDSQSVPVQWQPAAQLPDSVLLASAAEQDVDLDAIRRGWEALQEDYPESGWRIGGGLLFRGDTRPRSVLWADGFRPLSQRDGRVVYTTVRVNRAADHSQSVMMDDETSELTLVHQIYVIDAPGGFGVVEKGGVISVHWPGGLRSDRVMGCFEIPAHIWRGDFAAQADELPRYWRPNPGYSRDVPTDTGKTPGTP
ncbi:hypothetical protein [Nocardia exalbida]|uniref:hypothetical protein n=1 Tax=Nocardia exalbida TaxID=290231 RepID=UPI0002F685E9|nr:hypothetical protein [Nocardia exalbida]